jgi:hypothetical protein
MKGKTIIIQEEVKIPQENRNIILENGDRIRILKEAIPQEDLVRASVRDKATNNSLPREAEVEYQLSSDDIIGWFANQYNMGDGWFILKASDFDKKEFGDNIFRTYTEKTNSTNIIKINILTGMYAFIDNQEYLNGVIKFQRMTKYNRLLIEPTQKAFREFNIV